MNYYDDNLIWKDIIETISRELKRNNLMIKKEVNNILKSGFFLKGKILKTKQNKNTEPKFKY